MCGRLKLKEDQSRITYSLSFVNRAFGNSQLNNKHPKQHEQQLIKTDNPFTEETKNAITVTIL